MSRLPVALARLIADALDNHRVPAAQIRDQIAGSQVAPAAAGSPGVVALSAATPHALGVAAPGSSGAASDAGHVHTMPSAADVGAIATSALTTSNPAALGAAAAAGSSGNVARLDHVHPVPSASSITSGILAVAQGGTGVAVQPAFHVYRATNSAAVVNNTRTKYTFTHELFDPTNMFDFANNRCTPQAGNWVFYMGVVFAPATPATAPAYLNFHLYKNGAIYFSPVGPVQPLYGAYHGVVATIPVFGATGTDSYELYVQHTLGADVAIAGGMASFWAGVRLGA